jgi:hypothetical protein
VRFTAQGSRVHAIVLGTPRAGAVRIADFAPRTETVRLLGHGPVSARVADGDLVVDWPQAAPASPAHALACDAA